MSENQTLIRLVAQGSQGSQGNESSKGKNALICVYPGSGSADSGSDARDLRDGAQRDALLAQLQRADHRVVFAAPGDTIRLLELKVAPEERRHIDASLPFMLEDSLSTDIESLHFAKIALDQARYGVAVVSVDAMQHWRAELGDFAELIPWIPEPLLLPWHEGEWTLIIEGDSVLLRSGACRGARIETSLLSPLLEAMALESPPASVLIYGRDESADRALMPASIDAPIAWRRGGLASACLVTGDDSVVPNLLQGEFAPKLPYARWWSAWKNLAALVLVGVLVHLLAGWLDYRQLSRENLALRSEIQAVYRELNPRGAVSDAEKQLNQQLSDLRGDDGGGSFTGLLASLGEVVAASDKTVLASLAYSRRSSELRVNLLSNSFNEVETIREQLVEKGYPVELENSTRSGERVRARLRVAAPESAGS